MRYLLQGLVFVIAIMIMPVLADASAKNMISPIKQVTNGIHPSQVLCTEGWQLIFKSNTDAPTCVTKETGQKLIQRGWGKLFYEGKYEIPIKIQSKQSNKDTVITSISSDYMPRKGLVAEWNFEKNVLDTSNNKNDGTYQGGFFANGVIGKALAFDGFNVINVKSNTLFNFTDSFSISFWMKTDEVRDFAYIISNKRNNDGIYAGWTVDQIGNKIQGRISDWSKNKTDVKSQTSITDNKFHNVIFVVDRTNQLGKIYLDGVFESSEDISLIGNVYQNSTGIDIGAVSYPNTPVTPFSGILDQVRLYNRTLTQEEILTLSNEISFS